MDYDIKPTLETIEQAAKRLEDAATDIRRQARYLQEDGDLTRAAEVASLIAQLPAQCRLDLLVTRPLRAATHHANMARESFLKIKGQLC